MHNRAPTTAALTSTAMVAFAANSLLCRLALGEGLVDAASFTTIRVVSGAVTLALVALPRWRAGGRPLVDWRAAAMLVTYMVFFSYAYLSLSAGTGALVLFGAVQLTMFVVALWEGETFSVVSWAGLALAAGGLVYLVSPGLAAPDLAGATLMAVAGIAWGIYSLRGRGAADPVATTASNFIVGAPVVLVLGVLLLGDASATPRGVTLAAASGAVTSGLGYIAWYAALGGLTATRAATVQLSVPVIAAFGGVMLLGEDATLRLLVASAMTLGGVAIVLAQRSAGTARAA